MPFTREGCTIKGIQIGLILTINILTIRTYANEADAYALLTNKVFIKICSKEALQLHQGVIEKERVQHQQNQFEGIYEIQASDGSEWQAASHYFCERFFRAPARKIGKNLTRQVNA